MKRKRKQDKASKEAAAAAYAASQGQEPSDWWEDFSKRITGSFSFSTFCFWFTVRLVFFSAYSFCYDH